MNNLENNRNLVINFIDIIWNQGEFDELNNFIHQYYVDHSLPANLPANIDGLKLWIAGTGKSFEHKSIIEEHVTEGNKSIIKFRMLLKHIGPWRDIEPTGAQISTIGYRTFRIAEAKIIEHWALLDGNSIENQLTESSRGCKFQK